MHRMLYLAAGAALALTPTVSGSIIFSVDGTAPSSDVVLSNSSNASFLRLWPAGSGVTAEEGRGQTFVLPDAGPTATAWNINELTLQKNGNQTTGAGSKLALWVFEYAPSNDPNSVTQWSAGDGISDGNPIDGTGVTNVLLNKTEVAIGGISFVNGQYLHLRFNTPLVMTEGKAYAFYSEFIGAVPVTVPATTRFQLSSPSNVASSYPNGHMLTTTQTANGANPDQDYSFHLVGTPAVVPEPGTGLVLIGVGTGLLLRRRGRNSKR